MEKSDLLQVFLSFSDAEIRDAKKFLRSPYFNKREDVVALFDFFITQKNKTKPDFSSENAILFLKKTLQLEKIKDDDFRYLMSYLLQLLYQFLSLQDWENNTIQREIGLQKNLSVRNLEKISEKKSVKVIELLEEKPFRDAQYHFQKYQYLLEKYNNVHKKRRSGEMFLAEMSEEFTKYYLAEALRQSCMLISHQNVTKQNYDLSFSEELIRFVESKNYQKVVAIAVYYHSFLSLKNPENEAHFYELKTILTTNWQLFSHEEIRDMYLIAINYCIKKQNQGKANFVKEGFDLYVAGLENKVLLENGIMSVFTYQNTHLLAIKLKEYDWVLRFLEDYKVFLPQEQRENHYNFNIAQYYFRVKNYKKAMSLLQTIEFQDVSHNLDARKMLLIMYYDLGEYDAMDSLMESFKTYLHRQKDLAYHKESFTNLLKFSKKLLLLNAMNKAEKDFFKQEIIDCNVLAEKNWLLEQF